MIRVSDVSVALGGEGVLDGVSLDADEGELVGLIGPNGAGKTTLLRTMSGVLTPDAGTVTVDGDDVHALSSRAASRRVAVVPQDTTVSFDFAVRQVVEMGRHPHRSRFRGAREEDRRAVEDAMDRVDVAHFAERSVRSVSGGERQRVVLARALAQETPTLLLDEPTANLDVTRQVETLALVRELADDGRTAVAAIHDLELAARVCDSLVLLADGAVLASGPPESVLESERLSAAFDGRTVVAPDSVTGRPSVTALGDPETDGRRVHVVGTGAETASVLARLVEAGHECSVGPVPEGDVAALSADALGAPTVTTPPFASLDASTRAEVDSHVDAADAVVLASAVRPVAVDPSDPAVVDATGLDGSTLADRVDAAAAAEENPTIGARVDD